MLELPQHERPRERLRQLGAECLSDAELIAILLRTGSAQLDVLALARQLLERHRNLRRLSQASSTELAALPGLGQAKLATLAAALELGRRLQAEPLERGATLDSPQATQAFVRARLRDRPNEVFACLFLDNRHRLIRYQVLFQGSIRGAAVPVREVVRAAMAENAAALILAHNHPSGVAEPSQADRQLTERLSQALELLEIRVLDHIVVGDGEAVSFAERGWL